MVSTTAADFTCLLVKIPVLISRYGVLPAVTGQVGAGALPSHPELIVKDVASTGIDDRNGC